MTPEVIANMLVPLIASAQLTQAQRYELLGRFHYALLGEGGGHLVVAPGGSPQALTPSTPPTPERGNIVIPRDKIFVCTACKKEVMRTVEDVYTTMKTSAFRECFEPELERTNGVWADPHGNAAVDCPSCKAAKTVWIVGKEGLPFNDVPQGDNVGFAT